MEAGGGGRRSVIAAMNVVPLIDILLVLLIIFMVISPSKHFGLPAQIPLPAAPVQSLTPVNTIVVEVLAAGDLRMNPEAVTWQDLGPRLERMFRNRAEKVAVLRGGNNVEFAEIARAIDIMRTSGVEMVRLVSGVLTSAQ